MERVYNYKILVITIITCAGADVINRYCDFDELCAFVGLHCKLIIIYGMGNVKFVHFVGTAT
jgi:hypothetical protein